MSSPEFNIFLPVLSRAGSYTERPLMNGLGEITGYISFSLAEQAGMKHMNTLPDGDELEITLSIMVLKPSCVDQSLAMEEHWDGVK